MGGKSASGKGSNADRTGVRSAGAGMGGVLGHGTGQTGAKQSVALKAKDPNSINSQNAAIGTFAKDPQAQDDAYGGMLDAGLGAQIGDALIGALPFISRTTKVNPVSGFTESNYSGGLLDGIGSILGGLGGVPGLGSLGQVADNALGTTVDLGTDTYGTGWGGQTTGGAPAPSGAPSPQGISTGSQLAGYRDPMARALMGDRSVGPGNSPVGGRLAAALRR